VIGVQADGLCRSQGRLLGTEREQRGGVEQPYFRILGELVHRSFEKQEILLVATFAKLSETVETAGAPAE
jgi:hypothetical protein